MTREELKHLSKEKNLNINFGKCPVMTKEKWKQYYNVMISNYGNIKDAVTFENIEPTMHNFKYYTSRPYVKTDNGIKYLTFLVYDLFIGLNRENLEVHHIDQNPLNNRADNLIAVTKSIHHKLHFLPRQKHLRNKNFSRRLISALKTANIENYCEGDRIQILKYVREFLNPMYDVIEINK